MIGLNGKSARVGSVEGRLWTGDLLRRERAALLPPHFLIL